MGFEEIYIPLRRWLRDSPARAFPVVGVGQVCSGLPRRGLFPTLVLFRHPVSLGVVRVLMQSPICALRLAASRALLELDRQVLRYAGRSHTGLGRDMVNAQTTR